MKKKMMPAWSEAEREEGERKRQAWEAFFAANEPASKAQQPSLGTPDDATRATIRARHEPELLRYPNVVGVDEGIRTKDGKPTGEPCLVVYVTHKVPRGNLVKEDILPDEIEGILVDVVPVGEIKTLPA